MSSSQLYLNAWVALVVTTIGYLDNVKVPANRVLPKPHEKRLGDKVSGPEKAPTFTTPYLEVSVVGELVQVPRNTQ